MTDGPIDQGGQGSTAERRSQHYSSGNTELSEAAQGLAREFGLSLRQAYRYLRGGRAARAAGRRLPRRPYPSP